MHEVIMISTIASKTMMQMALPKITAITRMPGMLRKSKNMLKLDSEECTVFVVMYRLMSQLLSG